MDEKFDYGNDGIKETDRKNNRYMSKQFKNRLYDRDTLLLFHYDVNFLFVLSMYARNHEVEKRDWKKRIREKFRAEIQDWLQKDFDFYAMRARPNVDSKEYITTHFKQVLGKIYTPFADKEVISLALDKKDEGQNKELINQLDIDFVVRRCSLGENPENVLPPIEQVATIPVLSSEKNVLTCLVRINDDVFKSFAEHRGKTYLMEKIPQINLIGIKYLLPMVGGKIDGYYDVQRIAIADNNGSAALRIRLGKYHSLGENWIHIYRTKMQPGELISMDYTIKMYTNEI